MFGGISVRKNIPKDEYSILDDFSSNIEVYVDGKVVRQNQSVNEQKNDYVAPEAISEAPVDPEAFFKSSLGGLFM